MPSEYLRKKKRGSKIDDFSFMQMDLKHINSDVNLVEIGINLKDYYPSVEWASP